MVGVKKKRRFLEGRSREGREGDRGERILSERDKGGGSEGYAEDWFLRLRKRGRVESEAEGRRGLLGRDVRLGRILYKWISQPYDFS